MMFRLLNRHPGCTARWLSMIGLCALAWGCGSAVPSAPTAPTGSARSDSQAASGFGTFVPSAMTTVSFDFAGCLAGSNAPACFERPSARGARFAPLAVPAAPGNLVASSAGSTVTLAWIAPTSGDPVSAYIIEAGSGSGLANLANFSTGNTATSFSATLVGTGTYFVRVRAVGASGVGAASNEVVLIVGGGCVAPGAPSGLTVVTNSGGTLVLSWTAASGSPSTYIVEAGTSPGASNLANSDLGSSATTFRSTGVAAGTYYVRIRARNACGISGPSNELTFAVGTTAVLVSISLTYTCRPCVADTDNYELDVEGGGSVRRRSGTTAATDTLTWTGALAPGPHYVDVRITNPRSWSLAFLRPATPGNPVYAEGGIKPSTIRVLDDYWSTYEARTFSRCGLVTAFRAFPGYYNPVYEIDVVLGAAATVC